MCSLICFDVCAQLGKHHHNQDSESTGPEAPSCPSLFLPPIPPHNALQGLLILFLWLVVSPHCVKLINASIQCISLLSGFFRSAYSYGDPSTLLLNCTQSYRGHIMTSEVSRHFCLRVCVCVCLWCVCGVFVVCISYDWIGCNPAWITFTFLCISLAP